MDCILEEFLDGPLFDSDFDTTNLEASYIPERQVRVGSDVGFSGFLKDRLNNTNSISTQPTSPFFKFYQWN